MKIRRRVRRAGFHLLRSGAKLAARNGMTGLRTWGERLGDWHFRLGWRKRRNLVGQISQLLAAHPADAQDPKALLREAYRINDRAILEIMAAYSGAVSPEQFAASIQVAGLNVLDQAQAQQRGVVLLGMHAGNGVALAVHLARLGYPMHVVYRESNKITQHFFRDGIQGQGVNAIPALPAAVGVRRMLGALKNGEILFILMDQGSKRGGVPVNFLGKALRLPPGPVELARRTGAPVIPVILDAVDQSWHFRLDNPIVLDRGRELDSEVKLIADLMQRAILAQPQFWSWHQRRWWRHAFLADPAAQALPSNPTVSDET
ncbi:MAG: lysophospholipid acyltransferase family protein [Wenzhouxiangella sp.]